MNKIKENWKVLLALFAVALYGIGASFVYSTVYVVHVTVLHVCIVVSLWLEQRQRAIDKATMDKLNEHIANLQEAMKTCHRAMKAQDDYADALKTQLRLKQEQLDLLLVTTTQVVKASSEDSAPQQLYTAKAIFDDLCNIYETDNIATLAERIGASTTSLRLLRDGTVSKPLQEQLEIVPYTFFNVPQKAVTQ